MNFSRDPVMILATGGGIGRVPLAPGTFGSLLALPICLLLAQLPIALSAALVAVFILAAGRISGAAEAKLATKDPGCIVIDEVAGQMVALLALPFGFGIVMAGFLLFRCLDIVKPFPIRWFEKRLPGGIGIVADDVMAGLMANLIIRIVIFFL